MAGSCKTMFVMHSLSQTNCTSISGKKKKKKYLCKKLFMSKNEGAWLKLHVSVNKYDVRLDDL